MRFVRVTKHRVLFFDKRDTTAWVRVRGIEPRSKDLFKGILLRIIDKLDNSTVNPSGPGVLLMHDLDREHRSFST